MPDQPVVPAYVAGDGSRLDARKATDAVPSLTGTTRDAEHESVSDDPTVRSVARIPTERPQRYVKQLVSHLGHRLTTTLSEDGAGTIAFPSGQCLLSAGPGFLDARAEAADEATLAAVEDVVARHLVRFATGEQLTVTWTRPGPP